MIRLFSQLESCRQKIRAKTGYKSCNVGVATISSALKDYDGLYLSVTWIIDEEHRKVGRAYTAGRVNKLDLCNFADWFIDEYRRNRFNEKFGKL